MFSWNTSMSPSRSSPTQSVKWSEFSPGRSTLASSPTHSLASSRSCATASSVQSNGVKTRKIRDLRLEVELRDARIDELEHEFEETERRAQFREGEMANTLQAQKHEVEKVHEDHAAIKGQFQQQSGELEEMKKQLEQFRQLMEAATLITKEQERQVRLREEEAELQKKKEAEEKAAAALAAQVQAQKAQEQEEEAARLLTIKKVEEEEQEKLVYRAVLRADAAVLKAAEVQKQLVTQATVTPLPPSNNNNANNQRPRGGTNGKAKKDCVVM